jgi:hypothetical protein
MSDNIGMGPVVTIGLGLVEEALAQIESCPTRPDHNGEPVCVGCSAPMRRSCDPHSDWCGYVRVVDALKKKALGR